MIVTIIIQGLIQVSLFLLISYLFFYKSWLKALGEEVAKLSTVEKFTKLEESVKKDFNESIESYKAKLNEDLSLKLESLKAEFEKNNISYQIQYSYLHQERAKVILEVYGKLMEFYSSIMDWVALFHPIIEDEKKEKKERVDRVNNAIEEFNNFYVSNKLFFSKSFCNYIDDFFAEYLKKGLEFGYSQNVINNGHPDHEEYKEYLQKISEISNEVKENFPVQIQNLEKIFRQLLKVEDE